MYLTRNPLTGKFISLVGTEKEITERMESYDGLCVACGEWTDGGCEPDVSQDPCESCGKRAVYGVENLALMGRVVVSEGFKPAKHPDLIGYTVTDNGGTACVCLSCWEDTKPIITQECKVSEVIGCEAEVRNLVCDLCGVQVNEDPRNEAGVISL
jgi:hypothetical protein